jgi:hypothetical protein
MPEKHGHLVVAISSSAVIIAERRRVEDEPLWVANRHVVRVQPQRLLEAAEQQRDGLRACSGKRRDACLAAV